MNGKGTARADRLRIIREAKLAEVFAGRRLVFVREVHLPHGQLFQSALGRKARHGFILRDLDSGQRFAVGLIVLLQIIERYPVADLPAHLPRLSDSRAGRSST
jgi:hypothetical protein